MLQICIAERAKLICEHLQATVDKPLLESLNEITKRLDGAKEYLSLVPPSLTQLQLNHYQLQAWIVCESLMLSTATNLLLEQKSKVDGMQERGTSFVTKYISSNRRCRVCWKTLSCITAITSACRDWFCIGFVVVVLDRLDSMLASLLEHTFSAPRIQEHHPLQAGHASIAKYGWHWDENAYLAQRQLPVPLTSTV